MLVRSIEPQNQLEEIRLFAAILTLGAGRLADACDTALAAGGTGAHDLDPSEWTGVMIDYLRLCDAFE
jgi:hypothetical protein